MFLWCVSEKLTPYPRSSRSSMVSSRSLIILCFTFKLIHFNLIFVEGIRPMTDSFFFFFVMWMSSFSSTICWKHYLCSTVCLYSSVMNQLTMFMWLYFGSSLFCSIVLFVSSFANTTLSWFLDLYIKFWSLIVSVL